MNRTSVDNILFSSLSGYNLYVPSKNDPSTMWHMLSETEVTVRPFNSRDVMAIQKRWRHLVEQPIDVRHILWPVDVVQIDEHMMGLVFRKRAFPKLEPFKTLLYNTNALGYQNRAIQTVVTQLLETFAVLHNGGYAYHAFDMNHMFYDPQTHNILIDFSLAVTRHHGDATALCEVLPELIAVEFLPPWVDFDTPEKLTLLDDYYALAALLFRLLIGRMPYQGRLMDGQGDMMDARRDKDPDEHRRMFAYYHSHPVFLFDPVDTTNAIGLHTHEEKIIDRWLSLPDTIRSMFLTVFSKDNIDAPYEEKTLYSAAQWLDALQKAAVIERGREES